MIWKWNPSVAAACFLIQLILDCESFDRNKFRPVSKYEDFWQQKPQQQQLERQQLLGLSRDDPNIGRIVSNGIPGKINVGFSESKLHDWRLSNNGKRVPAAAPLSLEQSGDPGNLGEAIRSSPINHLIGSPDQVRRERRRREKGEKRMKEREAGGLIIPDRGRRRRRRKRAVGGEQLKQEREEGVVGEATKGRPKQQKYERKKKKQKTDYWGAIPNTVVQKFGKKHSDMIRKLEGYSKDLKLVDAMAKLLVKVLQRKVVKDALSKMLGTTAAESAGKKSAMNAKSGIEGGKEVPNPFGDKADNISESEDEDDGHDQDEEDYDDDESEEEDYEEDEEEEEEKKEDGGEKEEDGKEKEVEEEEEDYD